MMEKYRRALVAAFWAAAAFAFVMALNPRPPQLPGAPSDKIQHIIAFVVLAGLARAAYPRASAWTLAWRLSLFGALIELLQAIPALNRDAELLDWAADTVAAAAVLIAASVARRLGRRS